MEYIDPAIVLRLRRLAQERATVPELLRDIATQLSLSNSHTILFANYMRQAFGLSLLEVKPIGGWSLMGEGELSDDKLNEIMMPHITANREWWGLQTSEVIK
jgi:hypothetical protein